MKRSILLPFNIYITELWWRCFYVITSFVLTFTVSFLFVDTFLFLEIYPFTKLNFKTIIATHVTELFDSVISTSLFVSYLLIFPYISYQVYLFFSVSLNSYQAYYLRRICLILSLSWIVVFLIVYNLVLPHLFLFFTQWETKKTNPFFYLELSAKIKFYLIWVNNIFNIFSFVVLLIQILFFVIFSLFQTKYFIFIFKYYRKYLSFCLTCFMYVFTPPDYFLQFFLLILSFIICDLIFFFLCFRHYQCLIPDSSIG